MGVLNEDLFDITAGIVVPFKSVGWARSADSLFSCSIVGGVGGKCADPPAGEGCEDG
jgi:hypothetical protein